MLKSRKIEKISLSILLAASLLVLAGFLPIRLRAFGDVAVEALRGAGADSVTVAGVSVTPWRGARVEGLNTYKRINDGEEYRVSAELAEVRCNLLWAALTMMASPDPLKPDRDIFRELYEKPLELVGDISSQVMSLRHINQISARGAGVTFIRKGKEWISADGAAIRVNSGRGALDGYVHAKTVSIPTIAVVENFGVRLSVANGRLDLKSGEGKVFGGKLGADLSLGLRDLRVIGGNARVKGLDLEKYCAGTGFPQGRLSGKVDFEARIEEGSPAAIDSVKARGSFSAANIKADNIAIQRAPAVNQLSKDLRLLSFSEVSGNFLLDGGKVNFDEIIGIGDVLSFRSVGWADFEGKLAQDFDGELSREFVAKLPRLVRNGLQGTESGGGAFKCRITGSFHKPRVEVDRSVYNRAIRNLFK